MTTSPLTYWYLELEGYNFGNDLFVKEIALLKGDRSQCYHYYVNQHAVAQPVNDDDEGIRNQKTELGLSWSFGEHTFHEAIALIKSKINDGDLIFVSDPQSSLYLKQYLPKITYQPCEYGFEMKNCPSEDCDIKHGNGTKCARRKVHEIRYADFHEL